MTRHKLNVSYLALSLGAAAMLAFTPTYAQAEQAPELSFYPATGWRVQAKTQKVATAHVQDCIISSEFNNGFILQIDGSHKWVQTLNLDLRQAALEPGQRYPVTLSAPGITSVSTFGQAANDGQKISIPLDGQKALYRAMRDSAVLDVTIENNGFRFYMVNFAGPAKHFEQCMAGGMSAPASGETGAAIKASITSNEAIAMEEAEIRATQEGGMRIDLTATPSEAIQEPAPDQALIASPRTVAENAVASAQPKPRKRYTEELAAQMTDDPALVALNDTQEPATPFATAFEEELFVPPVMDDTEIAIEIEMEAPPPPPIETAPPAPKKTAEDLNQMQLNRLADRTPLDQPAMAEPEVITEAEMEIELEAKPMPEAITPPAAFTEPVEEEVVGIIEKAPETEVEAVAEPMVVEEPEKEMVAEDVAEVKAMPPQLPPVKTVSITSPEVKYKIERQRIEADFRGLDNAAPAAGTAETISTPSQTSLVPSRISTTTNDPDIGRKISQLENMINDLERENAALKDELNMALDESREERMSISSDNWNLERATMRFNEAERQVKSLGLQLQKERAQCSMEKRDLEAMLFDPQVTSQQQLARLADLEEQLRQTEQKLVDQRRTLEMRIRELGG
jgi:hypothetical protein